MATTQQKRQIGKSVFSPTTSTNVAQAQPAPATEQKRMIGTTVFAQPEQQQQVQTTPTPTLQQSQPVAQAQPVQQQAPQQVNSDDMYREPAQMQSKPATPAQQTPQQTQKPVQQTQQQQTQQSSTQKPVVQSNQQLNYQSDDPVRLDEIRKNLQEAQVSNPTAFSDRATFNKSYNYELRSQAQRDILDAAFNWFHSKWTNTLFDTLMAWGDVPQEQKNKPEYKQAIQRKMDFDIYNSMPPSDLAKVLEKIPMGSATFDDLRKYNPQLLHEAQVQKRKNDKLKIVNGTVMKRILSVPVDPNKRLAQQIITPDETPDSYSELNKRAADELDNNPDLLQAFQQLVSEDDDIITAQSTIEEKRTAINNIKREIANLQNRIVTQRFEWDAPASYIAAVTAQLSRPLTDQLQFAEQELANAEQKLNWLHSIKLEEFNAYSQQYAIDEARRVAAQNRQYQVQDQETAFQRSLALQDDAQAFQQEQQASWFNQQKELIWLNNQNDLAKLEYIQKLKAKYPEYNFVTTKDWRVIAVNPNDPSQSVVVDNWTSATTTSNTWDTFAVWSDYVNSLWAITSYWGAHDNYAGIDFDGNMWDAVPSVKWKVVKVVSGKWKSTTPSYGNFVQVQDEYGNIHQYSHLSKVDVKVWDSVNFGQQIGAIGNSGYTVAGKWWDGSHLDYSMIVNGKRINSKDVEQYLKSYKPLNPTPSGSQTAWLVDPVTWVDFDFATRITSLVPASLRNSEKEQENLNTRIKALATTGLSPTDAALKFMWFNVSKPEDKKFAENLISSARQLPEEMDWSFVSTVADLVNKWDLKWAANKLENTVFSYAKKIEGDNFISEPKVKTSVQKASDLEILMRQLSAAGNNPVWVVDWSINKWLRKLKWNNAQNISTQVTQLVSKMRNDLIGANATAGEVDLIEPLIPSLNDTPSNFMIKLNNLKTAPLQQYNNIRTTYGLPAVTASILLNWNKVPLYQGQTMSNNNPNPNNGWRWNAR